MSITPVTAFTIQFWKRFLDFGYQISERNHSYPFYRACFES